MPTKKKALPSAVIEMGSNSIKVLVARCTPEHLQPVKKDAMMLRLGEHLQATGEITPDLRERALAALRQFQQLAQSEHAEPILVVATQAVRQASNSAAFIADLQRETGLSIQVVSSSLEAALTYRGACSGAALSPDAGVMDAGGGSTELILAQNRQITWLTSLPIGSGWVHDQFLRSNPPFPDEVKQAEDVLQTYLSQVLVPRLPPTLLVTGSSAQTLLAVAEQALHLEAHQDRLTRADLLACRGLLLAQSAEALVEHFGLPLERARVLPGGALLILAMMEALHLDEIHVSAAGVKEGVLLAYARYGEHWHDHPEMLPNKQQIGQAPPLPKDLWREIETLETFAHAAREELPRRAEKFLDWRDDVLKNVDVEAVHKMRVASRRLRASMDAYEVVCKKKPFKRAYRTVKKAAGLLGAARDTDVLMQQVQALLENAPGEEQAGLRWLLERLESYRQECQDALELFLAQLDASALQDTLEACLPKEPDSSKKPAPTLAADAQMPMAQQARRIAQARLAELYSASDQVDVPYAVRALHRLRIAAKRLRYTLELFEEVLPGDCKPIVKDVVRIQDDLGQVHDGDVLIALLRLCLGNQEHAVTPQPRSAAEKKQGKPKSFLRTELVLALLNPKEALSPGQRYGVEQLLRGQESRREEQYQTFRQYWYHLQEHDLRRHLLSLLERDQVATR
jgi:exopolyphosphatase/pppGpp-phosphohydrolase